MLKQVHKNERNIRLGHAGGSIVDWRVFWLYISFSSVFSSTYVGMSPYMRLHVVSISTSEEGVEINSRI